MRTSAIVFGGGWLRRIVSMLAAALLTSAGSAQLFIYLDFDGHHEANYPRGGGCFIDLNVPPFDASADANAPQEILQRVAEDFAPFDVEVTRETPQGIGSGIAAGIRVAIGGRGSDLRCDGVHVDGIATHPRHTNTVVAAQFDGTRMRSNKDVAQTVSHEVAHMLGFWVGMPLSHYTLPAHHLSGQTPILGGAHPTARDIWFKHHHVCTGLIPGTDMCVWDAQDDIASLAEALGMRRDDHADWPAFGTPLAETSAPGSARRILTAEGVVEMNEANWASTCIARIEFFDAAPGPGPVLAPHFRGRLCPAPHRFMTFKDFFRFTALTQGSASENLVEIRIDTVNEIHALTGAANLKADVELWFRDPSAHGGFVLAGWRQVPEHLLGKLHGADDLFAGLIFRLGPSFPSGEYAVGVKSYGGYSDIGQYRVRVMGHGVRETTEAFFSAPVSARENYLGWLYAFADDLEHLAAGAHEDDLVALLAASGVIDEADAASGTVRALVKGALAQDDPGLVLVHLLHGEAWERLSEMDRRTAEKRLRLAFDAQVKR